MSKGAAIHWSDYRVWSGYRILFAVLLAQTVVFAGCGSEFTDVTRKGSTVAVTSALTPPPTVAARESATTVIGRPDESQGTVVTLGIEASAPEVTDAPRNPTAAAVAAAATPPLLVAAAETKGPPSPQPTGAARDTVRGGGFDAPTDDSPCNPFTLPVEEVWFWANAVRWHPDGSVVFFSQGPVVYEAARDSSRITVVADAASSDRTQGRPVIDFYGPMTSFDIAPQGDRLVFGTCAYRQDAPTVVDTDHEYEIAVVELGSAIVERLTTNRHFENYPSWSPDGTRIALVAGQSSPYDMFDRATLHVIRADGSDRRIISIDDHAVGFHPPQWSPDGTRLAVTGRQHGWRREYAVFVVGADGSGSDMRRLGRAASGPAWSPDGTRVTFVGPETFQGDERVLFTMAADGTDVQRVPLPAGWEPRYEGTHLVLKLLNWVPTLAWSPVGDHLLYTCGRHVCVVALDGTPVGRSPIELARGSVAAWSPDGGRIAVAAGSFWDDFEGPGDYPVDELLYTMASDGTDVRLLAKYDAEGHLRAVGPEPGAGGGDVSGCAAGVVVPNATANPGLVRDCEVLLKAQAAWQHTLNWSTDLPLGEWVGIVLGGSPPRVHELRLAAWSEPRSSWKKLGLWGTLPPELGALDKLGVLSLSGNVLTGKIPPQLGQLSRLVELDLTDNYLGGNVPPELGALAALKVLALGNFLTGCVPPEWAELELKRTDLGRLGLPHCEAGM